MKTSDEIRLENLQRLSRELCAAAGHELSGPEFAAAIGVSKVYEWQLRTGNRQKINEEAARRIERSAGKPRGWLDNDHNAWPLDRVQQPRYLALNAADQAYVQGAMNNAIAECEARLAASPDSLHTGHSGIDNGHRLHESPKRYGT